jgi:hypothetical protein
MEQQDFDPFHNSIAPLCAKNCLAKKSQNIQNDSEDYYV